MVKKIPTDRLILGTNSPDGYMDKDYEGHKYIKSKFRMVDRNSTHYLDAMNPKRNEPQTIIHVLEAASALKNIDSKELAMQTWNNSIKLFNITHIEQPMLPKDWNLDRYSTHPV